jgi:thiol-disulfide isomerase/thioredoxin
MSTKIKQINADRVSFLQYLSRTPTHTILKLGATWCSPCKKIKNYSDTISLRLPENIEMLECDVDESFDLFASLKQKKMVNGIPAFLFFKNGNASLISDLSVSGINIVQLDQFFYNVVLKTKTEV